MPSSYIDSLAPIVKLLIKQQPKRVIDVGPGWGKYGLMCREYLNVDMLVGVDAYQGPKLLSRVQKAVYDDIVHADIRELNWEMYEPDMILLIDVIEHMSKKDGHDLLTRFVTHAPVLVATPKTFFEQHDDENPFEEHVSFWEWQDFSTYRVMADVSTIDALIYLVGLAWP